MGRSPESTVVNCRQQTALPPVMAAIAATLTHCPFSIPCVLPSTLRAMFACARMPCVRGTPYVRKALADAGPRVPFRPRPSPIPRRGDAGQAAQQPLTRAPRRALGTSATGWPSNTTAGHRQQRHGGGPVRRRRTTHPRRLGGSCCPTAPLMIAEQVRTLESLYPGRIDLGVPRAGYRHAHRPVAPLPRAADNFPQDVQERHACLQPAVPTSLRLCPAPGSTCHLDPAPACSVPVPPPSGLPFASPRISRPTTDRALKTIAPPRSSPPSLANPTPWPASPRAADTDAEAQRCSPRCPSILNLSAHASTLSRRSTTYSSVAAGEGAGAAPSAAPGVCSPEPCALSSPPSRGNRLDESARGPIFDQRRACAPSVLAACDRPWRLRAAYPVSPVTCAMRTIAMVPATVSERVSLDSGGIAVGYPHERCTGRLVYAMNEAGRAREGSAIGLAGSACAPGPGLRLQLRDAPVAGPCPMARRPSARDHAICRVSATACCGASRPCCASTGAS